MTSPSSIEPELQREPRAETERSTHSSGWRDFVLALSIAHFAFIQSWHGLLFERLFSYFNRIPVNRPSLAALLLNIILLTALLWLVGRWAQRMNRRAVWTFANLALCAVVLVPLNFARTHYWQLTGAKLDRFTGEPIVIAIAVVVLLGGIWFRRFAARLVMTTYLILSPLVLFTVGKTAWWLVRPPAQFRQTLAPSTPLKAAEPRIVWLLLDELDQRIAFEMRPRDVNLPELMRFYNECFHATNALPPGGSTRYSIPALTIGRKVRGARPTGVSELSFNGSTRWSETETVFSRARALGHSTALVGWFHPYDRILGRDLDRCEWYPYPPFEQARGHTLSEAALNQACAIFSQFQQRRLHIRNFRACEAASLNYLTNSPAGLTFLHLPIPHQPGIYDPKRGRLTAWKYSRNREYLDNLILADQLFGRLRHAMERIGAWENTWVILSSDHWWREAAHYAGNIDHRVPFIVKAPGQNESAVYNPKFNTLITYHLILGILKGDLTNSTQLAHWMDTFRTDPPSGYDPTGEPL
jgi:sulfatase-like protein